MTRAAVVRWVAYGFVILSSALNYLDRLVLSALAPTLMQDLQLSGEQFGLLLSAFSIAYALGSPVMGIAIDRLGLRAGIALVVGLWSAVGMATGWAGTLGTLLVCRAALGFAESGGIPASAKAISLYISAKDRAFGSALSQTGLTIGSTAAPLLTEWLTPLYGWRSAFVFSGALGFIWIPLWWLASRTATPLSEAVQQPKVDAGAILRDRRFWALIAANMMAMTVYSLWSNWTTYFLVNQFGLTREVANQSYAWLPPIAGTAGGLTGGAFAGWLLRRGMELPRARMLASVCGGTLVLLTALAPFAPGANAAAAAICIGFFGVTCLSVNYYSIPLDLFGPSRSAFSVSVLTGVFGLMQAFLSPAIGRWSGTLGWGWVCGVVAVMPLLSVAVVAPALFRRQNQPMG